jgi:hypothetical protein
MDERVAHSTAHLFIAREVQAINQGNLFSRVLGAAAELDVLRSLPSDLAYGESGQKVGERIQQLEAGTVGVFDAIRQRDAILPRLTEAQKFSYYRRIEYDGEDATIAWLVSTYVAE